MCRIFASTDPASYECITRSVRLNGHATSIRLEARFWETVDRIAASQDLTTPQFLSALHDEVLEARGEVANFASLLRVCCLSFVAGPANVTATALADATERRRAAGM